MRAQLAPEPVRILLLFGLPPEAPSVAIFTQQLRHTVRNEIAVPVEFYEEFLDFDRFSGRTPQLAIYFSDKYRSIRIDAIVAVGSVALRFATERLRSSWPRIPVIFALTIDNIINVDGLPPNVTGRFSPFSFGSILAMARGLQPDARRVVIIGGLSAIDSFAVSSALHAVTEQAPELDITLLRGLPFDSLLGELRRLPRQSIVLLANFRRDGRGQLFIPGEIVSTISRESSAPL
ncbi:MAG TPA: hypothetical protein VH080_02710, partial [Gemmatimonadaceae bacterium]|nr:hypothetical protein [Gemmatimonadaceae bacterium]